MELKDLMENGTAVENKVIAFEIRALICDVCGIVGHTSSYGCTKCVEVGK